MEDSCSSHSNCIQSPNNALGPGRRKWLQLDCTRARKQNRNQAILEAFVSNQIFYHIFKNKAFFTFFKHQSSKQLKVKNIQMKVTGFKKWHLTLCCCTVHRYYQNVKHTVMCKSYNLIKGQLCWNKAYWYEVHKALISATSTFYSC